MEEAGADAALTSTSISALAALYYDCQVTSGFNRALKEAGTYKEVLEQIVAVLLVTPLSCGLQDVLDVLEDSGALGTESCGSAVGSTVALERVGVDDEFEHLGQLSLGSEGMVSHHHDRNLREWAYGYLPAARAPVA